MKLMGAAAQRLKLRARGQTIGRIWKIVWRRAPKSDRRQGQAGRDALLRPCAGFLARQQSGDCGWRLRDARFLRERARQDRPGTARSECRRLRAMPGARRCATPIPEGRGASQKAIVYDAKCRRRSVKKREHGGRRLLDRTARHIDRRPIMPGTEPPRSGNFLRHRLLIDIFVVVAMRPQAEQTVLPDLHDALGRRVQADNQRMLEALPRRPATACREPAAHWRSSRRDWPDRSTSASSTCATRRSRPHRLPRDRRCIWPSSCIIV